MRMNNRFLEHTPASTDLSFLCNIKENEIFLGTTAKNKFENISMQSCKVT